MIRPGRTDRRLWLMLAVAAVASVGWLTMTFALVALTLEPGERGTAFALIGHRFALVGLTWGAGIAAIAYGLKRWFDVWVTPSVRLAEEAQILLRTDVVRQLEPGGNPETRVLAGLFNQLVAQRESLRHEMDTKVQAAAQRIGEEKSRLAALMSELAQSVVVCNLDGRILLYNQSAREQFKALQAAGKGGDGAGLLGLGRSIHAVFDRKLVTHALENVRQRMRRGAARPSAQFVTITPSGQLLRVQMAPVRQAATVEAGAEVAADPVQALAGYVLMLDDVMPDYEQEAERDRLLQHLSEGSRGSLASIQAAVEMLDFPDLEPAMRERFLQVVRDEVRAMGERLKPLMGEAAQRLGSRWPMEDMLGGDFVTAAARRIEEQAGVTVQEIEVDEALWLRVESFSLLQSLVYLAARLKDEFDLRGVRLRLRPAPQGQSRVQLDLMWTGPAVSTETVMGWELDPIRIGQEMQSISVRDVVERHGAAFWFERERARHLSLFRFLLPSANPHQAEADARVLPSRPEFYDFDLFRASEQASALEDMRLVELSYTVFDTETTGLNPAGGDEIIQIGATRIVNGKLLRQESYEQLVDPQFMIPPASIPIHGITQDMVRGQPAIDQALPAFHAFARDTVLVAHNAAFDMRFLQLKQERTGIVFDQPVLDTLLLSAVVHPSQESHRLEAIAQRFNIPVTGRHTAMGDAIVTAEVFLRLIPLLAEKGIHTLGQARAAAQKTYYARLKY